MYAKGSSLLWFGGFAVVLIVFSHLIRIPNLLMCLVIPSGGRLRAILEASFSEVFTRNRGAYSTCQSI